MYAVLPPVHRSPGEGTRAAAEVIIIIGAFRRQRSTDRGHCCAGAIYGDGDGAAVEVRHAPTGYVGRYPEAIGARRIKVAGVSARRNC
jgi:hypothetical protein